MAVFKATITLTVMLEADNEAAAVQTLDSASLADLAYEIDQGSWIGSSTEAVVVEVTGDTAISEALVTLGNDGTFFTREDEVA